MKTLSTKFFLNLTLLAGLASCGAAKKVLSENERLLEDDQEAAARAAADGSNIQGTYLAKFQTLNSRVAGTIPGSAQFRREDNKLYAFVRLFAGSPSVAHFQNVHMGNRCPTLGDDTNGDGFIDLPEALSVVGPVIIPLDWDISSQLSANRAWPKAFPNGSYDYTKITSFKHFYSDLKREDTNPDDNIIKLAADQGLALTGKVILIQGVSENPVFDAAAGTYGPLPETVAGHKRWKGFQTLPVVCGLFAPHSESPGVAYDGSIPGPVATVEEGQDKPAPEGAGEIPGSGTVIVGPSNNSGSNESESTTTNSGERPRTPKTTTTTNSDDDAEEICLPGETDCDL